MIEVMVDIFLGRVQNWNLCRKEMLTRSHLPEDVIHIGIISRNFRTALQDDERSFRNSRIRLQRLTQTLSVQLEKSHRNRKIVRSPRKFVQFCSHNLKKSRVLLLSALDTLGTRHSLAAVFFVRFFVVSLASSTAVF
uniref:Uncharacterized protein n=1 Tax=Romanomermis culicivorax TaxID=13658 RepID=A0A915HQM4_ROMCU